MIKQFTSASELHHFLAELKNDGKEIGFVPTMGALHDGHMALIDRAMKENNQVVCSIFVNPKQFNNADDLAKYPRTVEEDIKLLSKHNCHVVFVPSVIEIYPNEVSQKYNFGSLEALMEGEHRPGHFNGMAIVVKRLFEIVNPHRAYFGEKDFQQLMIVRKLVEMEGMGIEIVGCATSRELNGLAMSSRNNLLTENQRNEASVIYKELSSIAKSYRNNVNEMNELISTSIKRINSIVGFEVEYLTLVNGETLQPLGSHGDSEKPHLFTAVKVGNVRLIDNLPIIA